MLITVTEVVKRTQDALDDPTGSQFDKDSLITAINQCYDDLAIELSQLDLSYEEIVAVITPFAAGTTDLSASMGTGGLLEALLVPEVIEWKLVGDPDTAYVEANKLDKISDVPDGTQGIVSWEWRGSNIYVTKSSVDVTLRVRFQAMSTNLTDGIDNVFRGVTNILAYKVAEYVSAKRGGDGGAKLALRYGQKARDAMDNFEVLMVKNAQKQTRKFGSFRRRLRGGSRFVGR